MKVKLLTSHSSIADMENFAAFAALTCHANTEKPYLPHEVLGWIIKAGDESILEHITLTYSVKGLSRACLQELSQHRLISLSVENTRHTLRKYVEDWMKLFDELSTKYLEFTAEFVNFAEKHPDMPNDELKYFIPEFWPINLILTSNIRELRHIIKLRTNLAALKEFRVLAYSLFEAVPESFKYLLEDCVYREKSNYDAQKGGEA